MDQKVSRPNPRASLYFVGCKKPERAITHSNKLMCGFYNAWFMLATQGKDCVDIVPIPGNDTAERLKPKALFPEDFAKLLTEHGFPSHVYDLSALPGDVARVNFLKKKISEGKPVVISAYGLGRVAPHWITVCGYNKYTNRFHAYDPRTQFSWIPRKRGTVSSEDPFRLIGNRELTWSEVITLWRARCIIGGLLWIGRQLGLTRLKFNFLAITASE